MTSSSESKSKNNTTKTDSDNLRSGRQFHSESASKYWLPMDDEEIKRLNNQHQALKELFGGNIPQPVFDKVAPVLKEGGKFLDLCCGTGIFISEIATEYPNTECVGVDMVDIFDRNDDITNVSFKKGNLFEGLPFDDNTFDVVSLNYGICAFSREQWAAVTTEAKRVLKPGCYMINREPGRVDGDSDFVKWAANKYRERITAMGQVHDISDQLKGILLETGYDEAGSLTKSIYLGRPGSVNEKYLFNTIHVFKGMLPNLAEDLELTPDKFDDFLEKFSQHLKEPNSVWQIGFTYGRKPSDPTDQDGQ